MFVSTILRENERELVVSVVGNAPASNAVLIDASTISNALPATPNILSIKSLMWTIQDGNNIDLLWQGTPNVTFFRMSGSGRFLFLRDINAKLLNTAPSATGRILITAVNGNYSLIMVLDKMTGFNIVGSYQ